MTGLNRFDGKRVKFYCSDDSDSTSLYDDNIQSPFFEDSQKNIWFSTSYAIHSYQRNKDNFKRHFIKIDKGKKVADDYRVFFLERDTFLWFRSEKGIYRYNIYQENDNAELIDTIGAYYCRVDTTSDGSVKFVYGTGELSDSYYKYLEIDKGELVKRHYWLDEKDPSEVPKIVYDISSHNGETWVGTDQGLILWNRNTTKWKYIKDVDKEKCCFIPYDKEHLLLWGNKKGCILFNKKTKKSTPLPYQILEDSKKSTQNIYMIHIDKDENIWVSFEGSGLMYANRKKTKFKSIPIHLPEDGNSKYYTYWCFYEDDQGRLWYGTGTQGLFQINKEGKIIQHYQHDENNPHSLPNNCVSSIKEDINGKLWIATRNGIAYLNEKEKKFYQISDESKQSGQDFLDLIKLRNGDLLATTAASGIFKIRTSKNEEKLINVFSNGSPYTTIYQDQSGLIYICRNSSEIEVFKNEKQALISIYTIPFKGEITGFQEEENKSDMV